MLYLSNTIDLLAGKISYQSAVCMKKKYNLKDFRFSSLKNYSKPV